ncbi:hypothetical protein SEA_LITTLETOKYO_31 [Arthrobacter phage LittleTokyo]|nr:hypothetical protein SEA_LITTLETOKYO_31 [Arthrobacter phage LittleTokyo]
MRLINGRHDLPPLWDGVPVEWTGWSAHRTTLPLHVPADSLCCRQCGAVDEPLINFGIRPPDRPTYPGTRTKTTRSGHKYDVAAEVPSWPVRDLIAARCRHCRHDVITDLRTDEVWDLEEDDYQPAGSYPTDRLF